MPPTQGLLLFDSLPLDDREAFLVLADIVQHPENWSETEWIDFKNGRDRKFLEHWSKALSGFANSGGGLILWGIQTKNQEDHDVPSNLALVERPKELEGQLKGWLACAVDPPVVGVKTRAVSNQQNEGFVVAYVPSSDFKPHCAIHADKRYYLRTGHQFQSANTALLRMLFNPRVSPKIALGIQKLPSHDDNLGVSFFITNAGVISISSIFIRIISTRSLHFFTTGEFRTVAEMSPLAAHVEVIERNPVIIHPGMRMEWGQAAIEPDNQLEVSIFAKDMEPFKWKISRVSYAQDLVVEGCSHNSSQE